MKIFRNQADLRPYLKQLRKKGKTLGFVPTMGALHEGHVSLIRKSKAKSDITVCSIFVNPTQFDNADDLKKYPRPVDKDLELLLSSGCDIIYLPEVSDIYPDGTTVFSSFKIGRLSKILEGASRKGHFEGVVQVVSILLDIARPDFLFLGQKDYQQYLILNAMVAKMKNKPKVILCPTSREESGLAMSSRNVRLSKSNRKKASLIYQTLRESSKLVGKIKPAEISKSAIASINSMKGFKVDYFELMDAKTMKPVASIQKGKKNILITSVIVDGVRLLDNLLVG